MAAAESEHQYLRLLTHVVSSAGQLKRGEEGRRPTEPLTRTQAFLETHFDIFAHRGIESLSHYHWDVSTTGASQSTTLGRIVMYGGHVAK